MKELMCLLWFSLFVVGCVSTPYQVCSDDIPGRCTKPFTHEEVVRASEVRKAWGDWARLHVEVAPR